MYIAKIKYQKNQIFTRVEIVWIQLSIIKILQFHNERIRQLINNDQNLIIANKQIFHLIIAKKKYFF